MNIKKKICKGCRKNFEPWSTTQQVCSTHCAIIVNNRKKSAKAKQQRKTDKLKIERLRPKSWYTKKAQTSCNSFIRYRDRGKPCISCGKHHQGANHAGHYQTSKSRPDLRFHPAGIHLQCYPCNVHLSGNILPYRVNLICKVGIEMVEYMENFHTPQNWTIEDLKDIRKHFDEELKYLKTEPINVDIVIKSLTELLCDNVEGFQ